MSFEDLKPSKSSYSGFLIRLEAVLVRLRVEAIIIARFECRKRETSYSYDSQYRCVFVLNRRRSQFRLGHFEFVPAFFFLLFVIPFPYEQPQQTKDTTPRIDDEVPARQPY
jgi:hypothetical protein